MEWISVKERLPEYDVSVIGTDGRSIGVYSLYDSGDGWLWACGDGLMCDLEEIEMDAGDEYILTHWMPLPILPHPDAISLDNV